MKLINRKHYLETLARVQGTPDIKIITGVRRAGKSKLMEAFIDHIREMEPDANIIHINFNLLEFEELQEYHAMYRYISERFRDGVSNYVMIDEVQMCDSFEKAVNSLHAAEKYDIYITGSNAFLMSSDLATLFTGRTYEIEIFPFSFAEFQQYYHYPDVQDALRHYIEEGGMAGSYVYYSIEDKYRYISDDVFNALIVRDILRKYNIRNRALLDSLVDYMFDNIGNLTSVRRITNALISGGTRTSDKTVSSYLSHLCSAYAFYRVRRYDIRGKRYLSSEDKYYLSDHAFKYARLGTRNMDTGRTLENIVALELLRRGYEVYAGVLYKKEIDFVAVRHSEKIYYQVSDNISDKKTFQRETEPLLMIRDAYPKILLARTGEKPYQYEGIQIMDIAGWLLS